MRDYKIFLSGAIAGLTLEKANLWRNDFKKFLFGSIGERGIPSSKVSVINPLDFYSYEYCGYDEREVFDWEISQVITSDIVIVNLNKIDKSVGTCMELGAIASANKLGKDIKVVAFGNDFTDVHDWIKCSWLTVKPSEYDVANYVADYLLL